MFRSEMPTAEEEVDHSLESDTGASGEIRKHFSDIEAGFTEDPLARPPTTINGSNLDTLIADGFPIPTDVINQLRGSGGEFNLESS